MILLLSFLATTAFVDADEIETATSVSIAHVENVSKLVSDPAPPVSNE